MWTRALLVGLLVLLTGARVASADVLSVRKPGQACGIFPSFLSIQAAVFAAVSGDIIAVCPGTYSENVSIHVHNLRIVADGHVIIIPGAFANSPAFNVPSDDVTITGFEVTGFSGLGGGFRLSGNRSLISGNDIHDNTTAFTVAQSGHLIFNNVIRNTTDTAIVASGVEGLRVSENTISGAHIGIALQDLVLTTEVLYNTISGAVTGITLQDSDSTTQIHHNLVTAGGTGIVVSQCSGSVIRNNTVADNEHVGISVTLCEEAIVKSNLVKRNENGILVSQCPGSIISNNTVRDNEQVGIGVSSCDGAMVKLNLSNGNGQGIVVDHSLACSIGFNSVAFNEGAGIDVSVIEGCLIQRNYATRNNPPDCVWDGLASNTFSKNSCVTETPPGAWD